MLLSLVILPTAWKLLLVNHGFFLGSVVFLGDLEAGLEAGDCGAELLGCEAVFDDLVDVFALVVWPGLLVVGLDQP